MTEGDEWLAIARLRYRNPDDALRQIASALRAGCADPRFLDRLADQIDPDKPATFTGTKLVVHRATGAGAPPGRSDNDLALFLEVQIDIFGTKAEAAFAEAKLRFGAGRTKCTDALRTLRARRQDNPEMFEMHRTTAGLLKEAGHPDYQPL